MLAESELIATFLFLAVGPFVAEIIPILQGLLANGQNITHVQKNML